MNNVQGVGFRWMWRHINVPNYCMVAVTIVQIEPIALLHMYILQERIQDVGNGGGGGRVPGGGGGSM